MSHGQTFNWLTEEGKFQLKWGCWVRISRIEECYEHYTCIGFNRFSCTIYHGNKCMLWGNWICIDVEQKPIAYLSKGINSRNLGLSIYEKELWASVKFVGKWRQHHFIIKTIHWSLKNLVEQRITTPLQQKWLSKLLGLSYKTHYKRRWTIKWQMPYPEGRTRKLNT